MSKSTEKKYINSVYDRQRPKGITFSKPSKTKQAFAQECDVNNIIKKYNGVPILPSALQSVAQYGDFSEVSSFDDAHNQVIAAEHAFKALPSKIRSFFHNDPANLLEALKNPKMETELVELGLLQKTPVNEEPRTDNTKLEVPNPNSKKKTLPKDEEE